MNDIPQNNEQTKNNKKNKKKLNKKLIKVLLIPIVIIIMAVIAIYVYKYLKTDRPSYYETKMIEYDFAKTYNNGLPNDEENVTKSEAVKMIVNAILNGEDIDEYTDVDRSIYYENFAWVYYAQYFDAIEDNEITNENEAENITCIDAIRIFYNSKEKLLEREVHLDKISEPVKIKDERQFSEEELYALDDLITIGILKNNYSIPKDELLTKELLNELIINLVDKYEIRNQEY